MQEEKTTRREFVKRMAVAAPASVVVVSELSAEEEAPGTGEVRLYHETEEWRKYYETLR